jgi:hypothetical protein
MKKIFLFFIFKRLFPIIVILTGIALFYMSYINYFNLENVAYESSIMMFSFFVILIGLILYSKETSLLEIYYIFFYFFFGGSIFLV